MKNELRVFNNIRSVSDKEREKRYFSVVNIIAVLTESENPGNYWKVLKNRLNKEGNETVTICNRLKMLSNDELIFTAPAELSARNIAESENATGFEAVPLNVREKFVRKQEQLVAHFRQFFRTFIWTFTHNFPPRAYYTIILLLKQ